MGIFNLSVKINN